MEKTSKQRLPLYNLNRQILAFFNDEKNMNAFKKWYLERYGKPFDDKEVRS